MKFFLFIAILLGSFRTFADTISHSSCELGENFLVMIYYTNGAGYRILQDKGYKIVRLRLGDFVLDDNLEYSDYHLNNRILEENRTLYFQERIHAGFNEDGSAYFKLKKHASINIKLNMFKFESAEDFQNKRRKKYINALNKLPRCNLKE